MLPNAIKFTHLTFQQFRLVGDGLVSEHAQLFEVLGFGGNALLDHVLVQELSNLLLAEGLLGLENRAEIKDQGLELGFSEVG